jgi:hypothetical protein
MPGWLWVLKKADAFTLTPGTTVLLANSFGMLSPIRARVLWKIWRRRSKGVQHIQAWDTSKIPRQLDWVLQRVPQRTRLSRVSRPSNTSEDALSVEKELMGLKSFIQAKYPDVLKINFLADGGLRFEMLKILDKLATLSEESQRELGKKIRSIPLKSQYLRHLEPSHGYPDDETLVSPEELSRFEGEVSLVLGRSYGNETSQFVTEMKDVALAIQTAVEKGLHILIGRA